MDSSDFMDPMWEIARPVIMREDLNAYECPHCNHIIKNRDQVQWEIEGESFRCPNCMNELRILKC